VTYQDVLDAARPMARTAVRKAAVPARRESPQQALKVLKSMTLDAPGGIRPAASWTPVQLAMLREADKMTDPWTREALKASLYADREWMT
jgi:hypothetical protein